MLGVNVVLIERDAPLRQKLVAALRRRRCRPMVATSYAGGIRLLRELDSIGVLYVAEQLARRSGPDLLARLEREPRLATIPTVIRVSEDGGMMAAALRSGGLQTVIASLGVEAIARTIALARTHDARTRRAQAELLASRRRSPPAAKPPRSARRARSRT